MQEATEHHVEGVRHSAICKQTERKGFAATENTGGEGDRSTQAANAGEHTRVGIDTLKEAKKDALFWSSRVLYRT
ncbi:hypothetical protein ROS1_58080 [Roseibium sp. ROS1]